MPILRMVLNFVVFVIVTAFLRVLYCSFAILLGRKVTLEAGQISIKRSIPSALKNTVKNQCDHDLLCQPLSYSNASIQDKLNAKIHMLKL